MKVTKRVVDNTEPGPKDVWVWDSELVGFGLRVKPSGHKSYFVQYRDESRKTRKFTIGRHGVFTADEARSEARRVLRAVARGENPAVEKTIREEEPTVNDLAARYLSEHAETHKKPKSVADDTHKLNKYILPDLGARKVASITREDIAHLNHKLRDKPIQANRTVALLSKMMNLAELWGMRPGGSNPCRHLGKYKERKRDRYLSERELQRIGEALREMEKPSAVLQPTSEVPMFDRRLGADGKERPGRRGPQPEHPPALLALRLLLLTGARLGEVLTLKWEHVDFQNGVVRLPESKTGAKVIVLGPPAIKLLSEAPRAKGSPWVCPGQRADGGHIADLNGPWRRLKAKVKAIQDKEQAEGTLEAKDRVDLSTLRIHDLRHSFASVGAGDGLSLPTIGALLGHTQAATTQRYAHLANDPLRQAAGIVAGHIAAVLEGKPGAKVVQMPAQEEGGK